MFVARKQERYALKAAYESDVSQFVAVYGRRRIGKTLLVREAFGGSFTFQHAGLAKGSLSEQLFAFGSALEDAGLDIGKPPANWLEAFKLLKLVIRASTDARKVIFIDELSWMDTPRSGLITALEWFWNSWASARKDVVLIVCASATSWMLDKVVHNKGGLYNRLTLQIALKPFTLEECEQLVQAKGVQMSRQQMAECYMVMGGVPFYWDFLQRGLSLAQNIDAIFFANGAPLAHEFDYLFASLFRHPEDYMSIIRALCSRKAGMTRNEIAEAAHLANSGSLTQKLSELEACGFVRRYRPFGKKSKGSLYQLIDNFTLFHYKFLKRSTDEHFWTNATNSSAMNAWRGVAFERVCLEHVTQIKRALGIAGVQTEVGSWSCAPNADNGVHGSQIDLLIARKDGVVNLCEMKYCSEEYAVTRAEESSIRRKVDDFLNATGTKSAVHVTLVTTHGLKRNIHSDVFQAIVTIDELFA